MGGGSEYVIAGRKVGSHWLSMATLGVFFGGIVLATSGGPKEQPQALASKIPAITADSSDEENFIKQFLKEAEEAEKKH